MVAMVNSVIDGTYSHSLCKAVFVFSAVFILMIPPAGHGEDFSVMGVTFPYPVNLQQSWVQPDDTVYLARYPLACKIRFHLSETGCVDSVIYDSGATWPYVNGISQSLKCLEFQPARIAEVPVPFILPATVTFYHGAGKPRVRLNFPSDHFLRFRDRKIVETALRLNGIHPAELVNFPPYYCRFGDAKSETGYFCAVQKIELAADGTLKDFEILFNDHAGFSDILSTVILYADFKPAVNHGVAVPSELYLVVRFFDNIFYPTSPWPPKGESKAGYPWDYVRLETVLHLDSVLHPPIPINIPDEVFYFRHKLSAASLPITVRIDTLGNVAHSRIGAALSGSEKAEIRRLLKTLRFYPAKDILGRPVRFEGELLLGVRNSETIRIIAKWLPFAAPPGEGVRQ
ncbi:MAG: hypothetical protein JSV44_12270 [Candidatus Zixiibacteriota bacterium]|nr:MAG: hypothetical protein JSV44_12270 [candidate division Zixibacteria bacterium]